MLLQMDIEGGEYDVLTFESIETLGKFSVIIVEFHSLDRLFDEHFLKMFTSIFEKLYGKFSICHVHPNNCRGTVIRDGIEVPILIEVTFIRNDLVDNYKLESPVNLPHELDQRCVSTKNEVSMPSCWWVK